MNKIRLMVADDHPVVRAGLIALLGTQANFIVVGAAADAHETQQLLATTQADVLLLDLRMPEGGGLAVLDHMKRHGLKSRALILTTYEEDQEFDQALQRGARGYLLKDSPKDVLFDAIARVHQGELVITPHLAQRQQRLGEKANQLSTRELEVLQGLAREAGNRAIAQQLFISEATVKTHLQHIYDKLGCKTRTAAVMEALRRGLLRLEDSRGP